MDSRQRNGQAPKTGTTDSKDKKSGHKPKEPVRKMRLMQPRDVPQCLRIFKKYELEELVYGLYTYRELDPEGSWVTEHYKTGKNVHYTRQEACIHIYLLRNPRAHISNAYWSHAFFSQVK